MHREIRRSETRFSAHQRLLASRDDDPLSSIANLFDVAMVFAVALLLALTARQPLRELMTADEDLTVLKNPGAPDMEIIRKQGEKLEHYRASEQSVGGDGERLGTAYRLSTGEVVYVPEHATDATAAGGGAK